MIFSFIWSIRRKHPLKLLTAVLEKYSVKVTGWRFAEEEDGCAVSYEAKLVGEGGTGPGAHYGLPLIRHHTKVIFCRDGTFCVLIRPSLKRCDLFHVFSERSASFPNKS